VATTKPKIFIGDGYRGILCKEELDGQKALGIDGVTGVLWRKVRRKFAKPLSSYA